MAELLKNIYSRSFFDDFNTIANINMQTFDVERFNDRIFNNDWKGMELKQRMRHIALTLNDCLHGSFSEKLKDILSLTKYLIAKKRC